MFYPVDIDLTNFKNDAINDLYKVWEKFLECKHKDPCPVSPGEIRKDIETIENAENVRKVLISIKDIEAKLNRALQCCLENKTDSSIEKLDSITVSGFGVEKSYAHEATELDIDEETKDLLEKKTPSEYLNEIISNLKGGLYRYIEKMTADLIEIKEKLILWKQIPPSDSDFEKECRKLFNLIFNESMEEGELRLDDGKERRDGVFRLQKYYKYTSLSQFKHIIIECKNHNEGPDTDAFLQTFDYLITFNNAALGLILCRHLPEKYKEKIKRKRIKFIEKLRPKYDYTILYLGIDDLIKLIDLKLEGQHPLLIISHKYYICQEKQIEF